MSDASPSAYQISFARSLACVRVEFNGITIADSDAAMVLKETRLAPTFYFPRDDVRMDLLDQTDNHTHCPFKGNASYWTVNVGDRSAENAVWSYEEPYAEATEVKDYVAFDWDRMDAWFENDAPILTREAEGAMTDNLYVDWLLRDAWQYETSAELVDAFATQLVEQGLPVIRFGLLVRTLHPQMFATRFTWRHDQAGVDEAETPHDVLLRTEYLESPYAPILQGVGGVRRRLEGDDAKLDFPVLKEFKADGATDYVAMPLAFSDGQLNIVTMLTDRAGGFTTSDLGQIYEVLPILARLFEIQALRRISSVLLDTYLGRHAGPRVLDGLIKRGDGEIIHAVIWFCDLRSSTALTEALPRDEYLALLNLYFDCMAGAVIENGGEVLKYIGDAVMAIFPIQDPQNPNPQAAHDALAAVKDAQARIHAVNAERQPRGEPTIGVGIGLHRGDVTYGNIGTDRRLGACAVEVLMLGDWRAAAGEMGFWPECGHLARPTLGWKSQTGRPERKRFAFHTRSMGTARPGASALAGQHLPQHVATVPIRLMFNAKHTRSHSPRTFAKPRRLNRRNPSTSLIHPFGASESHLRCAYRALPAGLASFSPMRCVAGSRAGSTATWDLPSRPSATCASMPRSSSSNRSGSLQ